MNKFIVFVLFIAFSFSGRAQNYINDIARIKSIDTRDLQRNMCISRDRKYLAFASSGAIKIVDVQNFKMIKIIPVDFNNINLI
jgi:hypothetical protein